MAASCNNRGVMYLFQANYPNAEELFGWAGDIWSKLGSEDLHDTAVRGNLAMLDLGLGQFEEARKELASVAATYREDLPREHPLVAVNLNQCAVLARALGNAAEGQALAEQALAISEKTWGPEHPATAAVLETLAACYRDQGHYAKAETTAARGTGLIGKCCGGGHFFLAAAWDAEARGRSRPAISTRPPPCAQAEKVSLATLGRNHPEYAAEQYTRARWAIAHGQPRHALRLPQPRPAKSSRSRKTSPP